MGSVSVTGRGPGTRNEGGVSSQTGDRGPAPTSPKSLLCFRPPIDKDDFKHPPQYSVILNIPLIFSYSVIPGVGKLFLKRTREHIV